MHSTSLLYPDFTGASAAKVGYEARMTPFETFKATLAEFATNNVTAMEGFIQVTFAEAENLKLLWAKLDGDQKAQAKQLAKDRGIDVSKWA